MNTPYNPPSEPVKSNLSGDSNTNMWAMVLHLSVFIGYFLPLVGIIAPIAIWQIKKDQMRASINTGASLLTGCSQHLFTRSFQRY